MTHIYVMSLFILGCTSQISIASAKDNASVTPEQRQQMAELHERMAKCLKSDRSLNDCKTEMHQGCSQVKDKEGCPMMGNGHKYGTQKSG